MRDLFREVLSVMFRNRTRLLLTGFSVGWGIFILIVLLGSGNGITRGVGESFGEDVSCKIHLVPGKTSKPWHGHSPLRSITFHSEDADALAAAFPDEIASAIMLNTSPVIDVTAGPRTIDTKMSGCPVGYFQLDSKKIVSGRDFTQVDVEHHNRVCLLGKQTADALFGKESDPVGHEIYANGVRFLITGVYDSVQNVGSGHAIFIPFTTCRDLFASDGSLSRITLVSTEIRNEKQLVDFKDRLLVFLSGRMEIDPGDRRAVSITSQSEQYFKLTGIIEMIRLFIWVVGLATMVSGIVGVSNIMTIGISERIREFGVRLVLGASRFSVIRLVLLESVIITVTFGYLGLLSGIGLTQAMAWILRQVGGVAYFDNPTIDFTIMMAAMLIMVVSGVIAGYFPARKATRLKLVDALKS